MLRQLHLLSLVRAIVIGALLVSASTFVPATAGPSVAHAQGCLGELELEVPGTSGVVQAEISVPTGSTFRADVRHEKNSTRYGNWTAYVSVWEKLPGGVPGDAVASRSFPPSYFWNDGTVVEAGSFAFTNTRSTTEYILEVSYTITVRVWLADDASTTAHNFRVTSPDGSSSAACIAPHDNEGHPNSACTTMPTYRATGGATVRSEPFTMARNSWLSIDMLDQKVFGARSDGTPILRHGDWSVRVSLWTANADGSPGTQIHRRSHISNGYYWSRESYINTNAVQLKNTSSSTEVVLVISKLYTRSFINDGVGQATMRPYRARIDGADVCLEGTNTTVQWARGATCAYDDTMRVTAVVTNKTAELRNYRIEVRRPDSQVPFHGSHNHPIAPGASGLVGLGGIPDGTWTVWMLEDEVPIQPPVVMTFNSGLCDDQDFPLERPNLTSLEVIYRSSVDESNNDVFVGWDPVAGADYYEVRLADDVNDWTISLDSTTDTEYPSLATNGRLDGVCVSVQAFSTSRRSEPARECFDVESGAPLVDEGVIDQEVAQVQQCMALGGDLYSMASVRGELQAVGQRTELFPGCLEFADSSCVDAATSGGLPDAEELDCSDGVTSTVLATVTPFGVDQAGIALVDGAELVKNATLECVQSQCITLLRDGAATALSGAAATAGNPLLGGTAAAVLVIAGKIVVAVVIAAAIVVLLEIILPTPSTGTSGILELLTADQIDTFDNWGVEDGAYIGRLYTYMSIVKSIEALGYQLDPANYEDSDLRFAIDTACGGKCDTKTLPAAGIAIYVPGGATTRGTPMPQTGLHISDAFDYSIPGQKSAVWGFPERSAGGAAAQTAGYPRRWYNTQRFTNSTGQANPCDGRVRQVCDEFPFYTTDQAVDLSGTMASLRPVPLIEGPAQGGDIRAFNRRCAVGDGEQFIIIPAPEGYVRNNGPSLGFRLTSAGTVPCHGPGLP